MKFGLFMMPLHPPGRPPAETYDEDLELVRRADRLGFSEIWVGEHMLLEWENMPTPELFIARALGETEQIVFGTGVVLLHFHDPVQVAHRIAMLDHLAKGRFMFGIGSGGTPSDAEMLRIDPDPGAQRERMMEGIELILSIWENGPEDFEGRFYSTRKPQDRTEMEIAFHMRPYQQPHPPIAVAGASVRSSTLAMAGERGWIPLSASLVHTSQLEYNWESISEGAERAGRTPSRESWRIAKQVYVAETTEQARKEAMEGALARDFTDYWMRLIGNSPSGVDLFKYDPDIPDEDVTPEYMIENYWIVGDPDYCIKKIREMYDQSGGFGTLLVQTDDWGNGNAQFYRSMELLANEVLPAVEGLEP
ncbi:MAG: LLM class flavin-dependent oxidoreductase [Dehalococcoidia bacterium]|nr:LLM class flavin-dependent oxidoreductase [Dehalococcoidia bacterium]